MAIPAARREVGEDESILASDAWKHAGGSPCRLTDWALSCPAR
jgi:hypothetical protein